MNRYVSVTDENGDWQVSTRTGGNGNCVEKLIPLDPAGLVRVRDTKNRTAGSLAFTPDAWTAFLGRLKQD